MYIDLYNLSPKEIYDLCEKSKLYSEEKLNEIKLGVDHGLVTWQILKYTKYRYSAERMRLIREGLEEGLDVDFYNKDIYSLEQMSFMKQCLKNFPDKKLDLIKLFSDCFNEYQLQEIKLGIESGLDFESIALYADSRMSSEQMKQVRLGLLEGLSKEQVKLYSDYNYPVWRMELIKEGLKNKLHEKIINLYRNTNFNYRQLLQIRKGITDGLTVEKVLMYSKPEFNENKMSIIRLLMVSNINDKLIKKTINKLKRMYNNEKVKVIHDIIENLCNNNERITEELIIGLFFKKKPLSDLKYLCNISNFSNAGFIISGYLNGIISKDVLNSISKDVIVDFSNKIKKPLHEDFILFYCREMNMSI